MKRILLTCLVFVWSTSILSARDGSVVESNEKEVVMSERQIEACNWAGFYIGANIGGAFGETDVKVDLKGEWEALPEPSDESFVEPLASRDLDANGLLAGGFFGYNFQWNNWVFGAEAGINYLGLRDSFNSGFQSVAPGSGDAVIVRHSSKTSYLVTIGPRLGYAWDKLLWYATGGLAIADVDFSQSIKEPQFTFLQEGSIDDTEVGWTLGSGVQYCFSEHWSVRAEYRYTDLECAEFSATGSIPLFNGNHEACLSFHSVTAGLAFHF